MRDLSEDEVLKIRAYIDANFKVEGPAARWPRTSSARSRSAATRASDTAGRCRSAVSAPTNARTRKGPKKAIAGKKKATK